MLLASPVSWSHHWVWAVPITVALWERRRVAAALWAGVFVARPILWPPWGEKREYGWRWYDQLDGNAYVLAAVALVGLLAWQLRSERVEVSATACGRCRTRRRTGSETRPSATPAHRAWDAGPAASPKR